MAQLIIIIICIRVRLLINYFGHCLCMYVYATRLRIVIFVENWITEPVLCSACRRD